MTYLTHGKKIGETVTNGSCPVNVTDPWLPLLRSCFEPWWPLNLLYFQVVAEAPGKHHHSQGSFSIALFQTCCQSEAATKQCLGHNQLSLACTPCWLDAPEFHIPCLIVVLWSLGSKEKYKAGNNRCGTFFPQSKFANSRCQESCFGTSGAATETELVSGGSATLCPTWVFSEHLGLEPGLWVVKEGNTVYSRVQWISISCEFTVSSCVMLRQLEMTACHSAFIVIGCSLGRWRVFLSVGIWK